MITLTPRPCQTLIATIDGIAQNGSLIHFWAGMPKQAEDLVEQAAGRGCRSTARRARWRRSRSRPAGSTSCGSSAMPRIGVVERHGQTQGERQPERAPTATCRRRCCGAPSGTGRPTSRSTKLSRPTNFGAVSRSQSVRLMREGGEDRARPTGRPGRGASGPGTARPSARLAGRAGRAAAVALRGPGRRAAPAAHRPAAGRPGRRRSLTGFGEDPVQLGIDVGDRLARRSCWAR